MIIYTLNKFRVASIIKAIGIDANGKLVTREEGQEKGLAIEYNFGKDGEENYCVVTFLKVKDGQSYVDWVRNEVLDFEQGDLLEWQRVVNEARGILDGILEVLSDE